MNMLYICYIYTVCMYILPLVSVAFLDSSTLGSTMGLWHDDAWLRLADELLWRDHRPSFEAWLRRATCELLRTAHSIVLGSYPDTFKEQVENCAVDCLGLNSSSVDCYADNAGAESVEPPRGPWAESSKPPTGPWALAGLSGHLVPCLQNESQWP